MRSLLTLLTCLAAQSLLGQDTANEVWPEVNVYVKMNDQTRLFFLGSGTRIKEQGNTDGSFGAHIDWFTTALFKQRMERTAQRADVARNKFLQLRLGYLFSKSAAGSSSPFVEHTPTIEVTPRYYFAKHVLVTFRNRADFRFVDGVYTPRARERLKIERVFQVGRTHVTPYGNAEAFYDWRYHTWHRFRYIAGAEWELGKHFVLEGYYFRQRDNRASTKYLNGVGIVVQLYF